MSTRSMAVIPALDGLRAIACIFVVVSHIPKYFNNATDVFRFRIHLGEPGVAIFFVLSGFLMSYLYISRGVNRDSFLSYIIARFSRIAPAYWVAIGSSYVVYNFIDSGFLFGISNENIFRHLIFIGSVGVFWSIPPEIQYYFFFMFVWAAWYMLEQRGIAKWIVVIFGVSFALIYTRACWPGITLPSKLHFFLAGTVTGFIFCKLSGVKPSNIIITVAQMSMIIFWCCCFYGLTDMDASYFYNSSLFFISTACLIFFCSFESPFVIFLFGNRLFSWIGKVSFSVYLFHDYIIYYMSLLFERLFLKGAICDVIVFIMAIFIPGLFSVFIELPLCAWTKRSLHNSFKLIGLNRNEAVFTER